LPKGGPRLQGWDYVTLLAHAPDEGRIRDILYKTFHENLQPPSSPTS